MEKPFITHQSKHNFISLVWFAGWVLPELNSTISEAIWFSPTFAEFGCGLVAQVYQDGYIQYVRDRSHLVVPIFMFRIYCISSFNSIAFACFFVLCERWSYSINITDSFLIRKCKRKATISEDTIAFIQRNNNKQRNIIISWFSAKEKNSESSIFFYISVWMGLPCSSLQR